MVLKNGYVLIGLSIAFVLSLLIWTWVVHHRPLLVLDMKNASALPKRFRTTSDLVPNTQVNTEGLASLNLIGSGQFSEVALQWILQRYHKPSLTIIDLRQESHGFLNGDAISWYGPHDAANARRSPSQVEQKQAQLLQELNALASVQVHEIFKKTRARVTRTDSRLHPVHEVKSELELAKKHHVNYLRIYVQDHHAPDPHQVDRFLSIVKNLPADEWIYLHCRGGSGRTTLFMAMVDIIHHAKQMDFNEIIAREVLLGGKNLSQLPPSNAYKYKSAVERLVFLRKFYEFARANPDPLAQSWSAWSRDH